MNPPAPRLARARVRLILTLIVATVMPTVAACASTSALPPSEPIASGPAWSEGPLPTPTGTPTPTESPMPPPTADVAVYSNRLPRFPPAPTPIKVTLGRNSGQAAMAHEIPTTQPVAFLTIDDGATRHPMAYELLRRAKVPVTLFLTTNYVSNNQDYFTALRDTGYARIENHTVSHPSLPEQGYSGAKNQLCGANNNIAQWFGRKPVYFRPPFGNYDGNTLAAAWDCGLQAGFHWRETVDAGNVYYQRPDKKIHQGDIILMHFRPAFPDDFVAALSAIHDAGLVPAFLDDYVNVGGATAAPAYTPPQATGAPTTTSPAAATTTSTTTAAADPTTTGPEPTTPAPTTETTPALLLH